MIHLPSFLSLAVIPMGSFPCRNSFLDGFVGGLIVVLFVLFSSLLLSRNTSATSGRFVTALRLVSFRVTLEAAAWLTALVLFSAISLLFFDSEDFGFLLYPFILTMFGLRLCAWWLVGGKGIPALSSRLHTSGLGLSAGPLVLWTAMGIAISVVSDLAMFAGTELGRSFFTLWNAPYM